MLLSVVVAAMQASFASAYTAEALADQVTSLPGAEAVSFTFIH